MHQTFLSKYVDDNAIHRGISLNEDDNPPSPMLGGGLEDTFTGPSSTTMATGGGSSPFPSGGMRGPQSPRDCGGIRFPAPHTPSSSNPHTPASPHHSSSVSTSTVTGGGPSANHPSYNLTSPPASHMPHPSPGGLLPASPLNPQPSPHMVHSPGPNTLYLQGHPDSLFTAMSPANTNWPGSPNMPRPSPRPGQSPDHKPVGQSDHSRGAPNQSIPNLLPNLPNVSGGGQGPVCSATRVPPQPPPLPTTNRSWAGAVPTIITHEKFELLCRASQHPCKECTFDISPLERFLGCVYIRRQLYRNIQNDDALILLNSGEPGMVLFKVENLQCQVILNPVHMQSLHLKITQLPPVQTMPDNKSPIQLCPDDIQTLEQFFDTRVVIPPYKPNALHGFCRVLSCAPQVLRDFVQIMRLEMKPELAGDPYKWTVQFCMRVPPSTAPIVPIGSPGVLIVRLKILFFVSILINSLFYEFVLYFL